MTVIVVSGAVTDACARQEECLQLAYSGWDSRDSSLDQTGLIMLDPREAYAKR